MKVNVPHEGGSQGSFSSLSLVMAKMAAGNTVRIACFGDSTTDGQNTTGWVANPVDRQGNAVGNINHEATAMNAWPARLQTLLREMYHNNNIHIFNAGYSGKTLADGWAVNNFDRAVTDNPYYGVCDAVFIDFGLNDIPAAGSQIDDTLKQTTLLFDKIEATGALPVLLTSGPIFRSDSSGRRKSELELEINTVKKYLANKRNIPIIDKALMLKEWMELNADSVKWTIIQEDALHFGDSGHLAQASFIAAELYSGTFNIHERVQYFPFMDSRIDTPYGRSEFYNTPASRFPNLHLSASTVNARLGTALLTMWVKVNNGASGLIYHAVRNENISSKNTMFTQVINATENKPILKQPSPNQTFAASTSDIGSFPVVAANLNYGLYKIQITLPQENVTDGIFYGYFSIRPGWLATFSERQKIRTLPLYYHKVGSITGSRELFPQKLADRGDNFWGLGYGNSRSTLYFKASLSKGAAIGIMNVDGVKEDSDYETDRCIGLFRAPDNTLSLFWLIRHLSGVCSNVPLGTGFDCGSVYDDNEYEYKIVLERNADTVALSFYFGYNATTSSRSIIVTPGEELPFALGGAFGSTWSYRGNSTVKVSEAFLLEEKLPDTP
ncbi:hypothetical protein ED28_18680 [[Pantoea] beijingensis]|uniref:SGNH hydrolase-type esterase domain-containing protein n=1 Tax=[Pantoea] beijingensis TaxID=1324864 RepID=A0A443I902_9GAMM|nr:MULTISPECIES: SGNH/GDSL hydrolase family protein [Erwiniaceae]RWR00513.1 hypothetical protein ED28_18680 [[Pantoea] beijingensis]